MAAGLHCEENAAMLESYAGRYRQELAERVIPFWYNHSLDREYGGYFTCLERDGSVYDTRKYLWLQGRAVWMFSRLYNTFDRKSEYLDAATLGLDFIRQRHAAGYHYFVANMSARAVDGWVALGVPFCSAGIMNPRSAESGVASIKDGKLYLQLKPGETRIIRTFDTREISGERWPVFSTIGDPVVVKGTWKVTFIDGGPELPAGFTTTELRSWTELGDEEARRFAGTARYSIEITIPEGANDWEIDLGDVRESARIFINGKEAAGLYSVPHSAPAGKYLKPGNNLLEIEVTNLSANRIRDLDIRKVNWKIFNDINFVDHTYTTFDASNWSLTPSGLLGPVTLTPMKVKNGDMEIF